MLNPEQKIASEHHTWPILMLAGAGSGKTHTLTYRVANLIKKTHIDPSAILCVTFTNKAAKEMRERIAGNLGVEMGLNIYRNPHLPFVSTFHSMGVYFLRQFIDQIGYEKNFVIYDESDARSIVSGIMKEKRIDTKEVPVKYVQFAISRVKNGWGNFNSLSQSWDSYKETIAAEVYPEYQKQLKANNALDFDDILLKTYEIIQKPEVLERLQERFTHFCVDEYQDTNEIQYQIITLLAGHTRNLCVVGDDWQGIYSWRGANIQNILNFQSEYPDAMVVKLEQNYRSTGHIIWAANHVIKQNHTALDKTLRTEKEDGDMIKLHTCLNERSEASLIASTIDDNYNQWAILYRTNSQSRGVEEALIKTWLPYIIYGGIKFYDRREIRDILAYLRCMYTPQDTVSFKRIVNVPPRKIWPTTMTKVVDYMREYNLHIPDMWAHVQMVPSLRNPGKDALALFLNNFDAWVQECKTKTASQMIAYIIESIRYKEYLEETLTPQEVEWKLENISELQNLATRYDHLDPEESLSRFLEDISLMTDQDNSDPESKNVVTLMTIHASKWLEFKNVIVCGLEESIFPHSRTMNDPNELEEERRLFYVAMTRAKERLFLTRAKERYTFGNYASNPPSRFLAEIPEQHVDDVTKHDQVSVRDMFSSYGSGSSFSRLHPDVWGRKVKNQPKSDIDFSVGDRLYHPKFWFGTLVWLDETIGQIAFSVLHGVKKLDVRFWGIEKT